MTHNFAHVLVSDTFFLMGKQLKPSTKTYSVLPYKHQKGGIIKLKNPAPLKWQVRSLFCLWKVLIPLFHIITHRKYTDWQRKETFPPTTHAAFGGSCWRSRWADVYLPVCACCTGWRIFCTASGDRQTHCNSSSQLLPRQLLCSSTK